MPTPYSIYYSREFRIYLYYLRHRAISPLVELNKKKEENFSSFVYIIIFIQLHYIKMILSKSVEISRYYQILFATII